MATASSPVVCPWAQQRRLGTALRGTTFPLTDSQELLGTDRTGVTCHSLTSGGWKGAGPEAAGGRERGRPRVAKAGLKACGGNLETQWERDEKREQKEKEQISAPGEAVLGTGSRKTKFST